MAQDHLAAPSPLPGHKTLAVFAGEWKGEEMVFPSRWTAGGPAASRAVARIDLKRLYLTRHTRDGKERKIQFSPDAEGGPICSQVSIIASTDPSLLGSRKQSSCPS